LAVFCLLHQAENGQKLPLTKGSLISHALSGENAIFARCHVKSESNRLRKIRISISGMYFYAVETDCFQQSLLKTHGHDVAGI